MSAEPEKPSQRTEDGSAPIDTGKNPAVEGEMTDDEIQSAVAVAFQDAVGFLDSTLSRDREKAQRYYNGDLFGNEEEGRSKVVLTDVRDSILQTMPSLLRIFFGPERSSEYTARVKAGASAQDIETLVAQARQATNYVWDVVIREDNPGFMVFHDWFQDALLKKLGIVKVWTEDFPETTSYKIRTLEEELPALAEDPEVDLISVTDVRDQPKGTVDVEFTRTCSYPRVRFAALPPEELVVTKNARSLGGADLVAHRTDKYKSDLIALGIDELLVDEVVTASATLRTQPEEQARQPSGATAPVQPVDPWNVPILYVEAFCRLDRKRNGRPQLYLVRLLGDQLQFVDAKPVSRLPFAALCPYPVAHTLLGGLSRADLTMDLQLIDSSVFRGLLDSLSLSLFPATEVVVGEVEIEDVLSTEIGKVMRVNRPGMMREVTHEFLGAAALPVLDKLESIREKRTGRPQDVTGLNADALQSSTKEAVNATISGAQEHTELIARIFAETGVRDLMRLLLLEIVENPDTERMVQLEGQYVKVDPTSWKLPMDVRINVGLGNGLTEKKIGVLMLALAQQKEVLASPLNAGSVGPMEIWNTISDLFRLQSIPNVERYFKRPDMQQLAQQQQQAAQQQPATDPAAMMMAQAEMTRAQSESRAQEIKLQLQQQQQNFEQSIEQIRLQVERMNDATQMAMKERELELKFAAQGSEQRMRALLEEYRAALNAHVTARGQDTQAEVAKLGHVIKAATNAEPPAEETVQVERDAAGRLMRMTRSRKRARKETE